MLGRHHILPSGSLQIESVQSTDEGVYRCVAVNSVSNDRLPADNTVLLQTLPRQYLRAFSCSSHSSGVIVVVKVVSYLITGVELAEQIPVPWQSARR